MNDLKWYHWLGSIVFIIGFFSLVHFGGQYSDQIKAEREAIEEQENQKRLAEYRESQAEEADSSDYEVVTDPDEAKKKVYRYMKNAFDTMTNYGATYDPEVHDDLVAEYAADEFGISKGQADMIYITGELEGW